MANLQTPHIFKGGSTFEPQEVNTNFAAVAAKFGSLTGQDLASEANIANSQLENSDYEFTIESAPVLLEGTGATAVYGVGTLPFEQADDYVLLGIGVTLVVGATTFVSGDYKFGYQTNQAASVVSFGTLNYDPSVLGASNWETKFLAGSGTVTGTVATATTLVLYTSGWPTHNTGTDLLPSKVSFKFRRQNGLR